MSRPAVAAIDLGRSTYREALALQRQLHRLRVAGQIEDTLLLTEHEAVLTLGRRADTRHLRVSPEVLAARDIEIVATERGGDITYHGPGQLVAYPILDLKQRGCDVHRYVWDLEETVVRLLARYGLESRRQAGTPGVWAGDGKIASVGVYVSHWVTMHGVAVNLAPNPDDFALIHPCGLVGVSMTSVALLTATAPAMGLAADRYCEDFAEVFGVAVRKAPLPQIA